MQSFIRGAEKLLGVEKVINWGFGGPVEYSAAKSGEVSSAPSASPNPFKMAAGVVFALFFFAVIVFVQNFLVGYIAIWVLVKLVGIGFSSFYAIFPIIYVYLSIFNRLDWIVTFALAKAPGRVLRNMFFGMLFVLPAIYFITQIGMNVAADHAGVRGETVTASQLGEYVQAALQPSAVMSLTLGAIGNLFARVNTGVPRRAQ